MNKVQKIKEWISKTQDGLMDANGNFGYLEHEGVYHILCDLDAYIDSLQEESKKCMYTKDNYTDEDRKVLCDGCEEECEFNKKEEPVSEIDFEQELYKYFGQVKDFTLGMRIAKRFYGIGRNYQEPASEEQVKESLISKHEDKTCKENGNSLTQEPANDDLEKEVYEHLWKGRMGTDVSKPIYFSYDELLEVARYFAEWQKQLLMNNAITAEYWDNSLMLDAEMRGKYSDGNKVKIIIIKED